MTTIKERLQTIIKESMKGGDKTTLGYARSLSAAFKQKEVDERVEVDDTMAIDIIAKLVKQRDESIAAAESAGRAEIAAAENAEKSFLQQFLPQPLSEEEVRAIVDAAIQETGASGPKEMGAVMKLVQPQTRGRADGKLVSTIVKERLNS